MTRVLYFEHGITASFRIADIVRRRRLGGTDLLDSRSNRDPPRTISCCLRSIQDQVHYYLFDLRRIRFNGRQLIRQRDLDVRVFADRAFDQRHRIAHGSGEVYRPNQELTFTGISQHLLGQERRSLARTQCLDEQTSRGRYWFGYFQCEAQASDHTTQNIVEVVRDPAGEYSKAFQLLPVSDVRFEAFPFGNIPGDFEPA